MLNDIRVAGRSLLKSRGFTLAVVFSLGLGMTLCTTALAVVNAYLFTDLPYPAADRLYSIRYAPPGQQGPRNMEALDWRSLDDVIEHPIAWDLDMFYLLDGDYAESAPGAWVTPGFMEGLGIQPALGHGFDARAFGPGGENVALISHRLWRTRFAGDPHIVGRTFRAYVSDRPEESESFAIVGVLPERFWHTNPYTEILVPLRAPTYPYMVRLRPHVTADAAAGRIAALVTASEHAGTGRHRDGGTDPTSDWRPDLVRTRELYVGSVRPILRMAAVAAALVLLVACANAAGLMILRAARRKQEIAVRRALGAGPASIARLLMAEGLLLAAGATVLALVTTAAVMDALAPVVQQQLGRSAPGGLRAFALDFRLLSIVAGLGLLTTVACAVGALPTSLRMPVAHGLQAGGRAATEGRGNQRVRSTLIVLEIAASVALLSGSVLVLRSVMNLLETDFGFEPDRIVVAGVTLRQHRYPDPASRAAAFERMLERLQSSPGVEAAALTGTWPLQQPGAATIVTDASQERHSASAPVHPVSAGYFEALRIPVVAGRAFGASDVFGGEPVAVVSHSLARRLWPAGGVIGSRILVPSAAGDGGDPRAVRRAVVGVVGDVRQQPDDAELAEVYVPRGQEPTRFTHVLLRSSGSSEAAVQLLRSALRSVDPEFAADRARPLEALVAEMSSRPRFMATLLAWFGGIAAVVALTGLSGVVAYAVRLREREIAVRLAVGADAARITRLFLRQGSMMIVAGLAIGVLTALAAGQLIESQLFGVTPQDPLALSSAAIAFGLAALGAIWWPAHRAASTDPAIALRPE